VSSGASRSSDFYHITGSKRWQVLVNSSEGEGFVHEGGRDVSEGLFGSSFHLNSRPVSGCCGQASHCI
jgi:hypothetical protein